MSDRESFEAWAKRYSYRVKTWAHGGYNDVVTNDVWIAWQAATLAERERCANVCEVDAAEWKDHQLNYAVDDDDIGKSWARAESLEEAAAAIRATE